MSMPRLLLHQYDTSPFAEKIRRVLAYKRLRWGAVDQPTMMPKPDLLPLTGGYRRIPVLQIGADIYCDTQLIARVLDRLHPDPPLFPGGSAGTAQAWSLWADRLLFMPAVAVVFAEIGPMVPPAFIEDRSKMFPGRDFATIAQEGPHAREQVRALLAMLDAQLADARPWLLGTEFSLADAACYHPAWFLRLAGAGRTALAEFPRIEAWMARLENLGHGDRQDVPASEALRVARESEPAPGEGVDPREPNGLQAGMEVTVTPDDYAFDPVRGTLVGSSVGEVAIRRTDPTVGALTVHFPRFGYRITRIA